MIGFISMYVCMCVCMCVCMMMMMMREGYNKDKEMVTI